MEFMLKGLNPFKIQINFKLDLFSRFLFQNPFGIQTSFQKESCSFPFYLLACKVWKFLEFQKWPFHILHIWIGLIFRKFLVDYLPGQPTVPAHLCLVLARSLNRPVASTETLTTCTWARSNHARHHILSPLDRGRCAACRFPTMPTIFRAVFEFSTAHMHSPLSIAEPRQSSLSLPLLTFPILPPSRVALRLAFDESPPTSSRQASAHGALPHGVELRHPVEQGEPCVRTSTVEAPTPSASKRTTRSGHPPSPPLPPWGPPWRVDPPDSRVDHHGRWTSPLTVVPLRPKTAVVDCSSLVTTSSPLLQIEFPSSSACSPTSFSTALRPRLAEFGQCRRCRTCTMGAPLLQAVGCQPMSRPAGI
jgi:hypothetical protein